MPVGTTNRTQMAYIAETVFGTTPGVGAMQILRYTGESFDNNFSFTESAEIIADRMTTSMVRTAASGGGELAFELSYGMFDPFLEAALGGTWALDVVKTGTTQRSFTVEKQFLDVAQFLAFPGQRIDTLGLALRTGQIASGSVGFVGRKSNPMSATTVRATTAAAPTNPVMAPVDSISLLQEGGAAVAGVSEVTISLANSLRPLNVLNSADSLDVNAGRQRVSGTMNMYFQDAVQFAKFTSLATSSIAVTIGGASTLKYAILVPKIVITKSSVVAGGGDADLMVAMEWSAVKDTVTGTLIQVTRTP